MKSTVVIPCAGKGTRLSPLTNDVSKSMLEIGDYKLIDYAISECLLSDIDRILIISSPDDLLLKNHIENIFCDYKLPFLDDFKTEKTEIIVIDQLSPNGLGDAINLSSDYIISDKFGIILPDDFIISHTPMMKKMKNCSEKFDSNILLGKEVSNELVSNFGIIETKSKIHPSYQEVCSLLEKPNIEQTNSNLAILGRYFLNKSVFTYLKNTSPGYGGEIQLTDSLIQQLNNEKFYAIECEGTHFDVGSIKGFEDANKHVTEQNI